MYSTIVEAQKNHMALLQHEQYSFFDFTFAQRQFVVSLWGFAVKRKKNLNH